MAVSEHHSRTKAVQLVPGMVMGALLGKKLDQYTEIIDSFELCYIKTSSENQESNTVLDKDYIQRKLPLVNQVSADLDLIGWYSTKPHEGDTVMEGFEKSMHKQISEYVANPIYLKLDPYARNSDPRISGTLPVQIFEPVVEIQAANEHLSLIEVGWNITTEDVEIIGMEHNSKVKHSDIAPSAAIDYLRLQHSAVKMLKDRIKVIAKYVKDVHTGTLSYNDELMLDIARLSDRFPLMNSEAYARAFNMQCNDVALNTYLGLLTKGSMCKMNLSKPNSKARALSTTHARR